MSEKKGYSKYSRLATERPSIGIKSWLHKKRRQNTNEENNNIFNFAIPLELKGQTKYSYLEHRKFNYFTDNIINAVSRELDEDVGDIITGHLYSNSEDREFSEDSQYLENLKALYSEYYLIDLPETNPKNKEGKIYPRFSEDLFARNNIPYTKFERKHNVDIPLEKQTNTEFYQTLKTRVQGLRKCMNDPNETPERKEYYQKEYEKELQVITNLDTSNKPIEEKISDICKSIYWNKKTLDANPQDFNYEEYEKFLYASNNLELKFLRTFLPDEYFNFNLDKTVHSINMDLLKDKIINNDRVFRQYIFGFGQDIKKYWAFRPFIYEVQSMLPTLDYNYMCDKFVNWNLIMNLLYDRCAISNLDIPFSVRFKIPTDDFALIDTKDKSKGIKIRYIKKQYDLFDLTQTKFIGILAIKNYYKARQQTENNTKRLMLLYVFKNLNKNHWDRFDTIKGVVSDYFIVNADMQFINEGALISHPNITFNELRHFKNMNEKGDINIYGTELDNSALFMSLKKYTIDELKKFNELGLFEIEIKDLEYKFFTFTKKKINIKYNRNTIIAENMAQNISQTGGLKKEVIKYDLKILKNTYEKLLYEGDSEISGKSYVDYLGNVSKTIDLWLKNQNEYNEKYTLASKILYDYILIANDELKFYNNKLNRQITGLNITKYIPISSKFYANLELFKKYMPSILETLKGEDNLLYFGYTPSPIEYIKYNNYKIKNITTIIPTFGENKYKDVLSEWNKYKKTMQDIYNLDILDYKKSIYDLPFESLDNDNKYNLVIYTIYDFGGNVFMYENYLNTPNIFVGALLGLKNTKLKGTFILNIGSVAYKHLADIYLILSKYFEKSDLYYPEISNPFKKTGTHCIFRNFKGITYKEYNDLLEILALIKQNYPNGSDSFNIYTPELRHRFKITKPIDNSIPHYHINGFLNTSSNDPIYNEIREFNDSRYIKQSIYMTKLLNYITLDKSILQYIKIPTQEQLTNAILYCNKWGIEYWDKYSSKPFQDKFGRIIMAETFGLHQPIIYNFKTPAQFHTIRKITLKIPTSKKSTTKTITKSLTMFSRKTPPTKQFKQSKKTKTSNTLLRVSDFMKDIKLSRQAHDLSFRASNIKSQLPTKRYNTMLELTPNLEYSNNRLQQVGYLIDSRRDFTKAREGHIDLQNNKWWEVNKAFRFYKHKDDLEKIHLDEVVRSKLKDTSISQAWLKMYEIITDCNLIHTNRKGTFNSFHICEAPGTFINCINNYIHTKTKYTSYEWYSQSLNPKIARIKDQFGLIRRHPERWDYGADQTGDITKIRNINYYKKKVSQRPLIDLMTSDCGLAMKEPGYEKVAFASLLAILHILPISATMVYKILTPIDEPIILNLVYIAYCNFKELIFYKPVQNNHSREFYIIGKGYLGTEPKILEKFFNVLQNMKDKENQQMDLFQDKYPEAFVSQFIDISNYLADNYIYTIERNIYYLDNFDKLTPQFLKLMKDYYNEKNQDWLDKYKPLRMYSDVDKL